MWPGSYFAYGPNSYRPKYYIPRHNSYVPWHERIDTVISWITHDTEPANIVFLYYNQPDSTGHNYTTWDDIMVDVIKESDARAGQLIDKLREVGIYDMINLIFLSDQGMQDIYERISTREMDIDRDLYEMCGASYTLYHVQPKDERNLDMLYNSFKNASHNNGFNVYRKEELYNIPYNASKRITDLLLIPYVGYVFDAPDSMLSVHGYDPSSSSVSNMSAFFVARGPSFKKAFKSDVPINNIDLVPLLSKITGVPAPSNGSIERIGWMLEGTQQRKLNAECERFKWERYLIVGGSALIGFVFVAISWIFYKLLRQVSMHIKLASK